MNIIVFDIETIPDIEGARKLYDFAKLSDSEVAQALFQLRRAEKQTEFLRLHLHKIAAISVVTHIHQQLKVWSLGDEQSTEADIIQRFYAGIEKYTPTLISWNGSGFDLPVLHYRSLLHGISAPRYWESGENLQNFRWNNYLNRFHERHLDLMDVLAGYQARANAPLDEVATLLGFPGKMGMSGSKVWEYYQQGKIAEIRQYCETDVLNTYLVYLRFELIRGKLDANEYTAHCDRLKNYLAIENQTHFNAFLQQWQTSST
jgi:predicted PolB exonuclease-like 3'-5' exonuclease